MRGAARGSSSRCLLWVRFAAIREDLSLVAVPCGWQGHLPIECHRCNRIERLRHVFLAHPQVFTACDANHCRVRHSRKARSRFIRSQKVVQLGDEDGHGHVGLGPCRQFGVGGVSQWRRQENDLADTALTAVLEDEVSAEGPAEQYQQWCIETPRFLY